MIQTKKPQAFYTKQGPRAVLLLHAYSGTPNDVRMLCRFLEAQNYSVYAPLFRGHGTLEPLDILAQSTQAWQADVEDAIEFLKTEGFQEIAIFGLSMGGVFAINQLTKNDPVIIGGGSFCSPIFKTENQVPENFLIYAKKVYQLAGKKAASLASIKEKVAPQLREIEEFGIHASQTLNQIQVPIFLVQAGADEMIDPATVFKTAASITQTRFTLKWYPESGHVITVDPAHKALEADVRDFLDTLTWNEGKA